MALLNGMRLDLQGTCEPRRTDLMSGAIAAVTCRPSSEAVELATVSLFDDQQSLLDQYLALLAASGVQPRTNQGRCVVGQGSEGSYIPGDTGPLLSVERGGCFLDGGGMARYVATLPPFVLIEIDGKVDDLVAVELWAWLGNRDQPGSPTIWRAEGPVSPEK